MSTRCDVTVTGAPGVVFLLTKTEMSRLVAELTPAEALRIGEWLTEMAHRALAAQYQYTPNTIHEPMPHIT